MDTSPPDLTNKSAFLAAALLAVAYAEDSSFSLNETVEGRLLISELFVPAPAANSDVRFAVEKYIRRNGPPELIAELDRR